MPSGMAENLNKRKRSYPEDAVLFFSDSADEDAYFSRTVRTRVRTRMTKTLSNFFFKLGLLTIPEDFEVEGLRGKTFPAVECAFQAAKFAGYLQPIDYWEPRQHLPGPKESIDLLAEELGPTEAKKFGGKLCMSFNKLKLSTELWNEDSPRIMEALVRLRYQQDPSFKASIDKFAEEGKKFYHHGSTGSRSFWGGCFPADGSPWVGGNALGEILNKIAKE